MKLKRNPGLERYILSNEFRYMHMIDGTIQAVNISVKCYLLYDMWSYYFVEWTHLKYFLQRIWVQNRKVHVCVCKYMYIKNL